MDGRMARDGAEAHRACGCTTTNADTSWLERVRRRILLRGGGIVFVIIGLGRFSQDWNLTFARLRASVRDSADSRSVSFLGPSLPLSAEHAPASPRRGVRGRRLRDAQPHTTLQRRPRMCTIDVNTRGADRRTPPARRIEQMRARRVRRARESAAPVEEGPV